MRIRWKELGNPTEPDKWYLVKGIGEVYVRQSEIDAAAKLGGNPYVYITEVTSQGDEVRKFILGQFVPE